MTSPWSSHRGCVYPSCQGGVRNGHFCHSRTSRAHGDLRPLSTHLCEPLCLVQVWLPERGSQAVRCFVVTLPAKGWKHPEFQWRFSMTKEGPYRKLTAKEKFFRCHSTMLRFISKGRTPETYRFIPNFIPHFFGFNSTPPVGHLEGRRGGRGYYQDLPGLWFWNLEGKMKWNN